jgi:regulator of protease activity HflC (stomatin/prohibitin superfamily)
MFGIFTLILAVILTVGGLITAVSPRSEITTRAAGGGALLLGIVMIVAASTVAVPARTVGVVTAFGKPTGTLSNGLHLVKPWEDVEKMDASLQTNRYTGDSAIGVRLANQSEAKADASIQWQLREEDAEQMYLDYREFERIHNDLVDREFRASVNAVLARYNPLDPEAIAEGGIDLNKYANDIKKDMQKRMGKYVEVRSVALPIINYDEDTQRKIDQLQSEVANTRAAEQSKKTAKEIAEANEILRKSLSDEVLSQRCIEAAEKVGAAPVGCIKGSSATPLVDMRKQ